MEEARLIRFALAPSGEVVADLAARLPGRGVWLQATRAAVEIAVKKGGFARAFKAPAVAPAGLADHIERQIAKRCLDMIGLGRKAGAAMCGFDSAVEAIRASPPLGLIEASDGAADGREKLLKLSYGLWGREPPLVGCFSAAELGMAFGRDRVVHACWLQERMALRWAVEIGRLSGFRAITPASWTRAGAPPDGGPGGVVSAGGVVSGHAVFGEAVGVSGDPAPTKD